VACATTACDVSSGGYCCLTGTDQGDCNPAQDCGGGETRVECDEPGDCPQQICCGTFDGGMYTQLVCADSCNGFGSVVVCDGNGDCSGNDDCLDSQYLPNGYTVCR
jgi:hypothetical protein